MLIIAYVTYLSAVVAQQMTNGLSSHRLNTILDSDRVLVLGDGQVCSILRALIL